MNIASILLMIFLAHTVGGIAAFGSALLALPAMLILGADLEESVFVLLVLGLVQAIQISAQAHRQADWQVVRRMLTIVLLTMPIGVLLDEWLPAKIIQLLLALVLIGACASHWIDRHLGSGWEPPEWGLKALLIIGGITHGAFGTGGAALTIYGRYSTPDKESFRGTLSAMWIGVNIPLISTIFLVEKIPPQAIGTSIAAIPVALMATLTGNHLSRKLSQKTFSDMVATLLGASGLLMAAKSM